MLKRYANINLYEAGCDEAGRGALAGPVFAAAVILPSDYHNKKLNDSKLLSAKQRELLKQEIEKEAISFAYGFCNNDEIDKLNILNASILAMHKALSKLTVKPNIIVVDGNRFKQYKNIPYVNFVKGDSLFYSIAAASIIAKTYRDDYMELLSNKYPEYKWDKNKGYPTKHHRQTIMQFGLTPLHRRSFILHDYQQKIIF